MSKGRPILTVDEASKKSSEELRLVDVRTPPEFREVHIDWAENIPLQDLSGEALNELKNGKKPICLMCKTGMRSDQAAHKLQEAGVDDVYVLEGGIEAWTLANHSVVKGRKAVSLPRQVQITAGSLILIGVVLGYLLSPAWFMLSGFVGAGLLFAGVTNTCGLAVLLAKMPWNQ